MQLNFSAGIPTFSKVSFLMPNPALNKNDYQRYFTKIRRQLNDIFGQQKICKQPVKAIGPDDDT